MTDRYASLRDGLVGAWIPSASGSGLLLPDLSGQGNNGTLTNMGPEDWVSSQYGRALDFDGSNDYVELGEIAGNLTETLPFGVSIWFLTRTAVRLDGLLSRSASTPYAFSIRYHNTSEIELLTNGATAVGPAIPLNTWNHLFVFIAPNLREFYLNGTQTHKYTSSFSISANNDTLKLGLDYIPGSGRVLDGQLDDVRIYNRALSESEIKLLASRPGIGLRPQRRSMYYAPPTGARRRRILTSMP